MYLVDKYCWWEGKRRQRRNVIYWSLVNLWQVWERYEAQIRAWCTVLIGSSTGLMSAWLEGSCYMLYIKRTVAAAAAATNLPCCWFLYLQPNIIYTPLVHVVGDTEASGELYLFMYVFLIASWWLFTKAETCSKKYNWYKFIRGWRFVLPLLLSEKLLTPMQYSYTCSPRYLSAFLCTALTPVFICCR